MVGMFLFFFFNKNTSAKTKAKVKAAPPIAIPAIPPELSVVELELEAEVGLCVEPAVVLEAVVVALEGAIVLETEEGVNCDDVAVAVPEETTPLGPRSRYASQSGLGASGQLGSWQRLYNCVPTGGEHRTLYCAFNCADNSSLSCCENPQWRVEAVI